MPSVMMAGSKLTASPWIPITNVWAKAGPAPSITTTVVRSSTARAKRICVPPYWVVETSGKTIAFRLGGFNGRLPGRPAASSVQLVPQLSGLRGRRLARVLLADVGGRAPAPGPLPGEERDAVVGARLCAGE